MLASTRQIAGWSRCRIRGMIADEGSVRTLTWTPSPPREFVIRRSGCSTGLPGQELRNHESARPAQGREERHIRGGGVFLVLRRGCRPHQGSQQSVLAMVRAVLTFSIDASLHPERVTMSPLYRVLRTSYPPSTRGSGQCQQRQGQVTDGPNASFQPLIFRSSPSVFASIRLKLPGPGRPSAPDPSPCSGALLHARLALPARRARYALGLRIYSLPPTLRLFVCMDGTDVLRSMRSRPRPPFRHASDARRQL
jgi:hypothetical protein